jgi:colanic acid biosynthesis glycosyl transferase WcaI
MQITLLNQFYEPDIAPTAVLAASLARHLAREGHTVTVVSSRGGYQPVAVAGTTGETTAPAVEVRRLWTPRFGKARLLGRLLDYLAYYLLAAWTMLRLPRQDVVISLTTPPFIVAAALLHRLLHRGSRVVLWNMDCYPEAPERAGLIRAGGLLSRLLRAFNCGLIRSVDQLVCLDGAMRQLLQQNYGRGEPLPIEIIPNWEPLALFPSAQVPNRAQRDPRRPLVVLYQGNAGVGHEFETVLACAERLRDQPVVFRFVGGGRWWPWLEEQQGRFDLPGWEVRPYIPKDQTPALLAEADVALITLRESSQGVMSPSKLHSNLAAGLPVLSIGPVGSNIDEAIARFGCGVSLRNGDIDGAERFLRGLIASAEQRAELGRRARQAFEQAYCDQQTLPAFSRLMARLASLPASHSLPAVASR